MIKTVRYKKYKHKILPWITSGILHSIEYRDKLYRELRSINPETENVLYFSVQQNLRVYNGMLKKTIRKAKVEYYSNQFNKSKSNIRHMWSVVKEILNRCHNKKEFPNYFTVDGGRITDSQDISNRFNDFFSSVGPKLSSNLVCNSDRSVSSFLKQCVVSSFKFECVDIVDVEKIMKSLSPKNSLGHDFISTKFLKRIVHIIAKPLTLMINQSLCSGIFPTKLKIARVIPLFKKGDPHVFDNYRPISLLPAISKIFERIVFDQTYNYFTKNKLLYTSQYGFRKQHSTELAAVELVDRVAHYLDSGKLPISIFLDLSKAFDTLNHTILLKKLAYYGLNGTSLDWFRSYLSDRSQYVDYDGTTSISLPLTTGVPQGSILGPLLFIIYMNDIHEASQNFKVILYADDTNLTSPISYFSPPLSTKESDIEVISSNINSELNDIQEWLSINKLSLNVKKTKYMLFHYRQRNVSNIIPNIVIGSEPIERVAEFNFLGLTIDENLDWNPHLQKISNKVSRTLGVMCRLKNYLPVHILRLLYNSLVLPYLQYGILTWGFKIGRIEKLQKRAVRIITCSKYNAHTEPLFKTLNLLKVSDMFTLNLLKMYYKYKNQSLPFYVMNMFTDAIEPHDYNLRNKYVLQSSVARTQSGDKCVRCYLPHLINNTDENILTKISTHSYQGFVFYVKTSILNSYSTLCTTNNCYVCNRCS